MITVERNDLGTAWYAVKPGATVYMGSLVTIDQSALDEGVIVRGQADGVSDTTNKDRPLGVVVGHNLKNEPSFDATYKTQALVDEGATSPLTSTTEFANLGGEFSKGEKRLMVKVQLIGPNTVLSAPIYNDAVGVAPSLLTSTAGSANGETVTTNACDFTPVADLNSIYCRTGVNAGIYRVTDDTSTTVAAWDVYMNGTTATVGETYVRVPVRKGQSYVRFGDDTVCSYLNCSETSAIHYDIIHVQELNLAEAGKERVTFVFDSDAFSTNRA